MNDKVEIGSLLDIYGTMLTEHQRNVLAMYVDDDYSLAEIAEIEGISRQGAHDAISRASAQLYGYERSMRVVNNRRALLVEIRKLEGGLGTASRQELEAIVSRLRGIVEDWDGI